MLSEAVHVCTLVAVPSEAGLMGSEYNTCTVLLHTVMHAFPSFTSEGNIMKCFARRCSMPLTYLSHVQPGQPVDPITSRFNTHCYHTIELRIIVRDCN